jgi:hypothetical protein
LVVITVWDFQFAMVLLKSHAHGSFSLSYVARGEGGVGGAGTGGILSILLLLLFLFL